MAKYVLSPIFFRCLFTSTVPLSLIPTTNQRKSHLNSNLLEMITDLYFWNKCHFKSGSFEVWAIKIIRDLFSFLFAFYAKAFSLKAQVTLLNQKPMSNVYFLKLSTKREAALISFTKTQLNT